jgi:hypothetical protein
VCPLQVILLTPKGPKYLGGQSEVLTGSLDVKFHSKFLKLFLEVQDCTSIVVNFFFTKSFFYKVTLLEVLFVVIQIATSTSKNLPKLLLLIFSCKIDPYLHEKL